MEHKNSPEFLTHASPEDEGESTNSIDVTGLVGKHHTATGSFDLTKLHAPALTKLLHGLPMPALLVDREHYVIFSNGPWENTISDGRPVRGRTFPSLFSHKVQADLTQTLIENAFTERTPLTRELKFAVEKKRFWGRMHLRSLRIASERFILVLFENLTAEKQQLARAEKYARQLAGARDTLERRVDERTAQLQQANHRLVEEIAEHRRTEVALRQSEANYRAIFRVAGDAIVVHEAETGEIVDVNDKMCDIFGYTREQARDLRLQDLISGESPSSGLPPEGGTELPIEESTQPVEWVAKHRSGRLFWVEVNVKRAHVGGKDRGLAFVRDISERKRLEEQLRQAQKMDAVGRLAGGVAHDFNNVLTAIIGYSDLLMNQIDRGEPHRNKVEQIHRAAERAAALTSQLLAFGGQQVLDAQEIDIGEFIRKLKPALQSILETNTELVTVVDPSLNSIKADPRLLEHVLTHVCINARDAMPEGGQITLEASNVYFEEGYTEIPDGVDPGEYVMISVSDSGIGIPPEAMQQVFDPFFTTKNAAKSPGLGLSIVYGIVTQHKGHVSLHSDPGTGTTVTLYLPSSRVAPDRRAEDNLNLQLFSGSETILVVDDEQAVRDLTCEVLDMLGYTVMETGDPEEAMRMCRGHVGPLHLLLTDVVMPAMHGDALYARLSQIRPEMKVLYMSGYTGNSMTQNNQIDHEVHFLQKPFTGTTLAKRVREMLDRE